TSLSVVREPVWSKVKARIDAAVADGAMTPAERQQLLQPVLLIARMGDEALPALGDDALAAERLRALLYLAAPWAPLVEEAHAILGHTEPVGARPYAPGVLSLGGI